MYLFYEVTKLIINIRLKFTNFLFLFTFSKFQSEVSTNSWNFFGGNFEGELCVEEVHLQGMLREILLLNATHDACQGSRIGTSDTAVCWCSARVEGR